MYRVWLYLVNDRDGSEDTPIGAMYSYPTLLKAIQFCNRTLPPNPESQIWDIVSPSGKLVTHLPWLWEY